MSEYKFENTIGGQILQQLDECILECIEVPNDCLPKKFRNERDGCRTLAELNETCEEKHTVSQYQLDKAAKAERIEKYRQQWEENENIEYDVDEDRLYRNECNFVEAAVEARWIELDEE